ncbi:MAG: glycoside hydrolase family 97 N-terminal domain-containing protein, partial [Limisphaerales bacterium]
MKTKNIRGSILSIVLVLSPAISPAANLAGTNSWSLTSPDGQCEISVSLAVGDLSYQAFRDGKVVIKKSPLGLRRDDQDFENSLTLDRAEKKVSRREKYQLFAGDQPRVNHVLNFRNLIFKNTNGVAIEVDLAASDEGVAFRYHFSENSKTVHVVESELTSFAIPQNARGWMQPYHAAGPYTPAYEDFYFPVSPGDPPPDSRAKAVGWAFPALFKIPDADTWVLLTESGTDKSYCACHLNPDCSNGIYQIAFPLANEVTPGYTNKFGPEPRWTLPWTLPWRVIVMGKSAGDIATETLVTDLAPPSRIADT